MPNKTPGTISASASKKTIAAPASAQAAGGAQSTKVVTDKGAHVHTVASSSTATAAEPESVTVEVAAAAARADLGFTVKGMSINQVTKGSLADKRGVRTGWRVVKLGGKAVTSENEINVALANAKKAGKMFSIVFQVQAPATSGGAGASQGQDEGGSSSGGVTLTATQQQSPAQELRQEGAEEDAERRRAAAAETEAEEQRRAQAKAQEEQEAKQRSEEEQEEAAKKEKWEEEEEAAALAAKAEEVAAQARRNGMARFRYEMYDQEFPITNGSTTQEAIDEEYAFTFVMPGCRVHLSELSPTEMAYQRNQGVELPYIMERPAGVYFGLETGKTYYCYVEQNAEQLSKDQDKARRAAAGAEGAKGKATGKDDGRGFESCSCIYGAPCVDEYGCKDWSNRFAVANKNGWKGF